MTATRISRNLSPYKPGYGPGGNPEPIRQRGPVRPEPPPRPTRCCVLNCKKPFDRTARRAFDLCKSHYERFQRLKFRVPPGMSISELLEDQIQVRPKDVKHLKPASFHEAEQSTLALDRVLKAAVSRAKSQVTSSDIDPMFSTPLGRRDLVINRVEAVELAYDKLITFTKLMMPHPDAPDDVRFSLYQDALHHRAIAAALEEVEKGSITRLIIVAPPRHGKTELTSKKLVAWYSGRHPEHDVIFGTYNEIYAKDVGRDVRETVLSPAFAQVFDGYSLKTYSQAADRFETMAGGIIAFVGRGGTTTGRGGHLLVVDDPIKNRKEANSPTIREDAWRWFTQVVRSRMMTASSRIIIIMTRWHEDDIVGRLIDRTNEHFNPEEAKTWKIIDLPGLAMSEHDPLGRKPGQALWPERFPVKFLEDQQRADPLGFSALYQGRPTPPNGAMFLDAYLKTYRQHELPKNLRYYAASDHAVATTQFSDKTCLIPVGVDERDNIYVLRDVVWRSAPSDVIVDAMVDIMRRRRPLFWWAERGHITKSIGPFLRKRMNEEQVYTAVLEMTPSTDKPTRAQSILGRAAMGKVFFPAEAPWWPEAKAQLLKFPNGAHDDFADALAWIGMGLQLLVATSRPLVVVDPHAGTFASLLDDSNRRRRERAGQRASGGW